MDAKKILKTIVCAIATALEERPLLPISYDTPPISPLREIVVLDSPPHRPSFASNHGAMAPQSPCFH